MKPIDLRSDTVTTPSADMRGAMAAAAVGDDQYGEDPSVNRLQEKIAALLGKEAALFVPSGTMANQIGLKILTRPGDEVVLGDEAHIVWHEAGAGAANSGVQFTPVGRGGLFTADDLRHAFKPPRAYRLPANGAGRGREHPQPRRRRRLPAAGRHRHRRGGEGSRHPELPRRREAVQCGGRFRA